MSDYVLLSGMMIGVPTAIFWLLAFPPRRAAVPLSIVAIAVTLYAVWVSVTDKPSIGHLIGATMALAALVGPLMALVYHVIGRRSWRWRLACFAAGFPLGYGLIKLYDLFRRFYD
jgi:nitroreductase